jgi:hypothetical protein
MEDGGATLEHAHEALSLVMPVNLLWSWPGTRPHFSSILVLVGDVLPYGGFGLYVYCMAFCQSLFNK